MSEYYNIKYNENKDVIILNKSSLKENIIFLFDHVNKNTNDKEKDTNKVFIFIYEKELIDILLYIIQNYKYMPCLSFDHKTLSIIWRQLSLKGKNIDDTKNTNGTININAMTNANLSKFKI